jgi:V8-like Glu-specific endopeptidase
MRRTPLTGKRAIWLGLLATPALIVGAVALLGVTAGSAGPNAPAATALPSGVTQQGGILTKETDLGKGVQTLAQLQSYWTPERMANAQPVARPTPKASARTMGTMERMPQVTGGRRVAVQLANGTVQTHAVPESGSSIQTFTEAFHEQVPFMRWDWFGKYRPISPFNLENSENRAISAVHKMFFSAPGGGDFVCSSSTIGIDAAWTAGHCVHNGDGVAGNFSTNVMFCPSYDSAQGGINPNVGCWGAEALTTTTGWALDGNIELDLGGADASDNPVNGPHVGPIGNVTGWVPFIYADTTGFGAFNDAWAAFGYPAAPPFNGGKMHVCSSGFGYIDDSDAAAAGTSISIGCDMTGGSSGGPWYLWLGKAGQAGGAPLFGDDFCCNFVGGHNSWGHVGGLSPAEMNSPFYNCSSIAIWVDVNDAGPITCPSTP